MAAVPLYTLGTWTRSSKATSIRVEVQSITIIPNGVELLARAWKNGQPLGFGADGSVEIERFRIYNPPTLVPDANGKITRSWTDPITKQVQVRKLREDPKEALRDALVDTIRLVGKEDTKIEPGKVGNTTSTFYPDPNVESTSVDGYVTRLVQPTGESIATIVGGAGTAADDSSSEVFIQIQTDAGAVSPNVNNITRGIFLFDTSALPDGDAISSATLSLYGTTPQGPASGDTTQGSSVCIVASTPASNTALVAADYSQVGTTDLATRIGFSSWNSAGYNDFALNSSGIANISKTGVSKFAGRVNHDLDSSFTPWAAQNSYRRVISADTVGTTQDPKLVVEHAVPASGNAMFMGANF